MVHKIEMTPEERRSVWKAGLGLSTPKVVQPKWKPIETAPKDCPILAYGIWYDELNQRDEEPSVHVVEYIGGHWHVTGSSNYAAFVNATHWMELPAPPDIIGEQIIREEEEAEIRRELDFEGEFPHGLEGDE